MKTILQKDLLEAGLTENEAAIYLAALELGEASVSRLAKYAGVKRTTAYLVLDSLREKGLITSLKKETASVFFAEDPRKLHHMLERKKEKIDKIMPQLLAFTNLSDKKPEIRYFEGEEGIKDVYRDCLKYPGREILTLYSETYTRHFDEKFFWEEFIPKRVSKKISVRAILPNNETIQALARNDQKHLRRTKLIDPKKFCISIEINIYGGSKVSIISHEEYFGIVIESRKIYESLKNIFDLMWEYVPEER